MTAALCCPSCGAALAVTAIAPPAGEAERWVSLRAASERTGQPVSRLRRWVHTGRLEARQGPRSAHLVRVVDIDRLLGVLPRVERRADESDEIARTRGAA